MHIIGGVFRNRTLIAPAGLEVRPSAGALRKTLFDLCQGMIDDVHFLDLFAGSGAVGLEALSRGASQATFVDSQRDAVRCIHQNVASLGVQKQTHVLYGDVFRILEKFEKQAQTFEMIFADPPYRAKGKDAIVYSQLLLEKIDSSPLLVSGGSLFIEDAHEVILKIDGLTSLQLNSSRRIGSAQLHHFIKK